MAASLSVGSRFRRLCSCATSSLVRTDPVSSTLVSEGTNHIDMLELNSRLKLFVKLGKLNDARKLFDKMPARDEVSWTTVISGYVSAMNSTEALALFSYFWVQPGLWVDPFILSLALKACGQNLNVNYGESLHGYSVKSGLGYSVFVGSALLDMYAKVGKVDHGCRIFSEMPIRNVVSWTAIITGLVRAGYNEDGLMYFCEMGRSKVEYDSHTFAIALKACADLGALNYGRELHCQTMKRGFYETSYVANTLATMYNKCGKLDYCLFLFERMITKDVASWTTIITMYVQMGQEETAIEAFIRMRNSAVSPNEFTFSKVISGCANLGRLEWGTQLHAHVLHLGLVNSLSVANSLMTLYSNCGYLTFASIMFHEMPNRDVVSWSTIIAGYHQQGYGEEAFEYLSWMRRDGPKPTEFAFASVLSVSGSMAILDQGKQLHAHVLSVGLQSRAMIQSSLIHMYSKCGGIKEAAKVFDEVESVDIISWTAMINGYAEHGYSREAIYLFEKIPRVDLRPDSVTFIGVLTACSHAGLVDLGLRYFNLISEEYQINPTREHYGCMIDLLCRAGRVSDAEQMIQTMPFYRDDVVWSTLLRACRIHGDVDCGKRAAEKILELDPNCAGTHITLANLYAAKGQWKEAANMRKLMKEKGVIKEPGWSWIKIMDQVAVFVAGDRAHPQVEDIYCLLDLLASREELTLEELISILSSIED
ncbi:hypothetical protein HS088_TW22G01422 [Tripterygium wilfordii]|uniref:Pentatricopeptide repeat-containing protein n=1 Tax=Tripterygium wilfordii TaxID=458696 RepID=A0A7J7C1B8_TRIWF|nr:putative pentatricopeptide repeat-containing protein At3g47840 [Tripterygium wilfordii]KAF5727725.1 hypothetical protein HS088_TW22G01422 [Tripterygium wilfordii]